MAVVISKSLMITNRDSVPSKMSNGFLAKGTLKEMIGSVAGANGDSIGSTYLFGQIPSNARISSVQLSCPAIAVSGAADFGLYDTSANGSAVVASSFFKAAQALTAALNASEIAHGNTITLANAEQEVWQLLGLASDPNKMYDVVGTVTTALGGAGSLLLKVKYAE
jgi:hypothetical protein